MKHILVTSTRAIATLDLIRLLAKAGHIVFGAETFSSAIANQSRYLKAFDIVSSPKYNEKQYIEDLLSIIKKRKIEVLVPTCEEVFYIAKYKYLFSSYCEILCSSFDLLTRLHNKWEFSQLINDIDVASPSSFLITDKSSLAKHAKRSKELVFKPIYSRFASRTLICPDTVEKIDFSLGAWLAQSFIHGQEICSYNIAHYGKLSLHCCYTNKYRAGKGPGIYFHAVKNDKILSFVQRFVAQYKFHGQISFDFIIDNDNKIYVIECNPRLTSGLHLFRDNTDTVSRITNDGNNELLISESKKSYMLSLPFLIYATLNILKKRVTLRGFLHDLVQASCVTYDHEDRKPFYIQFFSLFSFMYRSIKNKKSILESTTDDIEWNG